VIKSARYFLNSRGDDKENNRWFVSLRQRTLTGHVPVVRTVESNEDGGSEAQGREGSENRLLTDKTLLLILGSILSTPLPPAVVSRVRPPLPPPPHLSAPLDASDQNVDAPVKAPRCFP